MRESSSARVLWRIAARETSLCVLMGRRRQRRRAPIYKTSIAPRPPFLPSFRPYFSFTKERNAPSHPKKKRLPRRRVMTTMKRQQQQREIIIIATDVIGRRKLFFVMISSSGRDRLNRVDLFSRIGSSLYWLAAHVLRRGLVVIDWEEAATVAQNWREPHWRQEDDR